MNTVSCCVLLRVNCIVSNAVAAQQRSLKLTRSAEQDTLSVLFCSKVFTAA